MLSQQEAIDETLESLWGMKEKNCFSEKDLAESIGPFFNQEILHVMEERQLIRRQMGEILMTETGEAAARKVIRAHRIGEVLLHHVSGWDFEKAACEFEHTSSSEMVDSICTLLGHPKLCPHGKPIPPGNCCTKALDNAKSDVHSILSLPIGAHAKVAYIHCADSKIMNKLNSLQIRPGSEIHIHQTYPCYVIECEGAMIALEENVGESIKVWASGRNEMKTSDVQDTQEESPFKGSFMGRLRAFFTGN